MLKNLRSYFCAANVCKDPNAEWKDCKDACPGTCQNTRPICASNSKVCVAGCQCKDAYVLSKPDGECVKIDNCAGKLRLIPLVCS